MSSPIYDLKGRIVGYRTLSQPSNESIVVRGKRVTDKINEDDGKEAYERIWRNMKKGR